MTTLRKGWGAWRRWAKRDLRRRRPEATSEEIAALCERAERAVRDFLADHDAARAKEQQQ